MKNETPFAPNLYIQIDCLPKFCVQLNFQLLQRLPVAINLGLDLSNLLVDLRRALFQQFLHLFQRQVKEGIADLVRNQFVLVRKLQLRGHVYKVFLLLLQQVERLTSGLDCRIRGDEVVRVLSPAPPVEGLVSGESLRSD